MSDEEMRKVADQCLAVVRYLGDRQDQEVTLKPTQVQKVVDACASAGNCFDYLLKAKAPQAQG